MRVGVPVLAVLAGLLSAAPARAGLYNPAEPPYPPPRPAADPNDPRASAGAAGGVLVHSPYPDLLRFLAHLNYLRGYGPPDGRTITEETRHRKELLQKVDELRQKRRAGPLTAAEYAMLGACLIRLWGSKTEHSEYVEEAIQVLEAGQQEHPNDFRILANLGTAYQHLGQLDVAERCLRRAVTAAPEEFRQLEQYHLTLVELRRKEQELRRPPGLEPVLLDGLFDEPGRPPLRFLGADGRWAVGALAPAEMAKLPDGSLLEAIRVVQHLLIAAPNDGRLCYLLGELANALGNLRAAHSCFTLVDNYGLSTRELRQRRMLLSEAVTWREVVGRVGWEDAQVGWLFQVLGHGLQRTLPAPDAGQHAGGLLTLIPEPPSALPPWAIAADTRPPPADLFAHFAWHHWLLAAAGGVLILLLFALQVRQAWRRRAARSLRPEHLPGRG
jgi:tetratricopeptide (TPR) repeat protein